MDDNSQEPGRPRHELEFHTTSIRDNNASFIVRRNGKAFYIDISPSQFINSPAMTERYLSYLEVLQSDQGMIGDIYDTDVFEWALRPFEPLFVKLAPAPISAPESFKVTLRDYLDPEFFVFALDIKDEELRPRRIEMKQSPYRPPGVWLDEDLLDDLETWTYLYNPAGIVLSFNHPEDALFKPPQKVLIDNNQTTCFFKLRYSAGQTVTELRAYKKIVTAKLDPQLHICRLHGVVMDDNGFVSGLLLSYIDHGGLTMFSRIDPKEPPASTRARWVSQLDAAITELHEAGVVWGDVKAENVLIDQDNDAWITDFGGGYTEGWVDKRVAGTVEGDLAGMVKLREFIFQGRA